MSDTAMTGAQFRRACGADPERWAAEFLVAFAAAPFDAVRSDASRQAFVAYWFRDAMLAAVREASAGMIGPDE